MYLEPGGVEQPRIIAGLQEPYLIGGHENIEGTYTVIAQVASVLAVDDVESPIRVIRNVPPTQMEVDAITQALVGFIEPARDLGVNLAPEDITIRAAAVIMQPIALYR
jgi:hypothetical protein